jgi:hypothetical protein
VAARVSAQSPDVQYLDVKPAVQAKGLAITNITEMAFSIELKRFCGYVLTDQPRQGWHGALAPFSPAGGAHSAAAS